MWSGKQNLYFKLLQLYTIGLLLMNLSPSALAQEDFGWWNQKHDWDGITNWQYYLIPSPGYFGPNAIPVPDLYSGRIDSQYVVELAWERHIRKGKRDDTHNLFARVYLPLFSNRVGLNFQMVPIEWYHTDTLIRDERRSREFDPKGTANGDLYIETFIQVLQEKGWRPDLMLRLSLRTASGNTLSGARFLDSPGYYFDATVGKTASFKNQVLTRLRWYFMAGFFVYQTNNREQEQRQNDCFLFGAGLDMVFPFVRFQNQVAGYLGYLDNRDEPIVYRLRLESQFEFPVNGRFQFQTGLQDWAYSSFRFSALFKLAR